MGFFRSSVIQPRGSTLAFRVRPFRARPASVGAAACLLACLVPTTASGQFPPTRLKNLRVLPKDIPPAELVNLMGDITRALGVRCTFCHVGEETIPLAEYDFASDDKPTKRKARVMIEMMNRINDTHLVRLEERAEPAVEVTCITCHRGTRQPRMLEDVVTQAYRAGGIDSAVATYDTLRQRYYGGFIYDFRAVPLVDAANEVARSGNLEDAVRLLSLNLEVNPTSEFARLQYIGMALGLAFTERGVDGGRAAYEGMRQRFGAAGIPERTLNSVGYRLLRGGSIGEAIAVFQLNVEAYPEAYNVYDSLGEAYAASGNVPEAIRNYERSLQLNPDNQNAVDRLRELRRKY